MNINLIEQEGRKINHNNFKFNSNQDTEKSLVKIFFYTDLMFLSYFYIDVG